MRVIDKMVSLIALLIEDTQTPHVKIVIVNLLK